MSRRIFLLRHGDAGPTGPDSLRPLTAAGRNAVRQIVQEQASQLAAVTRIVSSPFSRAVEAAEIAGSILSLPATERSSLLIPAAGHQPLFDWLLQGGDNVLLVGHNPLFSRALNVLLGYEDSRLYMGTAALAALELEVVAAGCAELLWFRAGN